MLLPLPALGSISTRGGVQPDEVFATIATSLSC
jgi:hypothetical protein